jgi:membrane dipeptidase
MNVSGSMEKENDLQTSNPDYLQLHDKLIVVEGHSDLMIDIYRRHQRGEKAVFLNKYANELRKGGVNVIILSTGGDSGAQNVGSDDPLWMTLKRIQAINRENDDSGEVVSLCTSIRDMEKALADKKIAMFMMIEGGRPLRDDLAMVELYYRLGIRSIQITWNGRNLLGDGCGERETYGKLTRFGKAVVKEMNRLGMVIDVSHISESTFYSVAETSDSPIIASHANARAVCDHVRNLTDEQIKILAEKNGVMGICYYPSFIDSEKPSLERLLDHVDHIAGLVGVDTISLGPDFIDYALDIIFTNLKFAAQGTNYGNEYFLPDEIKDVTTLPNLTRGLLQRGYSEEDIGKILGNNLIRVYKQAVG